MSALLFSLALVLSTGSADESPAKPERPGTIQRADAELLKAVRAIAGRVETIRGEEFRRDPIAVRVPDETRDVAAQLRAYNVLDRKRLAARGRAWSDLGLGGSTAPEVVFSLLASDLAGVGFDPAGNRLLVASDRLDQSDFTVGESEDETEAATVLLMTGVRRDEPVFCHLLMHMLQFERNGADHLLDTTDGLLARAAWAEGEANLVAVRYLFGGMGLADDVVALETDPGEILGGRLVPPGYPRLTGAVADLIDFVYFEGYAQAVKRFKAGGWSAINGAVRNDLTTRQVLHAGRMPLQTVFPEPAPPVEGLELLDRDVLGEKAIVILIARLTGKDNLALQVGDGWAGDRLYRWEGEGGAVTDWVTRWESDEDVEDLIYALNRGLPALFPGQKVATAADGSVSIGDANRLARVVRDGQEVRLLIASGRFVEPFRVRDPSQGGKPQGSW